MTEEPRPFANRWKRFSDWDERPLRRLAAAQNLSVPVEASNSDELRAAIVRGAEQRLAERRAAAS